MGVVLWVPYVPFLLCGLGSLVALHLPMMHQRQESPKCTPSKRGGCGALWEIQTRDQNYEDPQTR